MCGLAGWRLGASGQFAPAVLTAMTEAIRHRGPDDSGEYFEAAQGLALGFRRLSIIDLSAASHQPMRDAETGLVLLFNGELYNFEALRRELEGAGSRFVSRGDAEVVLKAFSRWGLTALDRFRGMFALALWDPRDGVLHLARDPMGMKPLYYHRPAGGVVFASEVKAFLAVPGFRAEVSPGSLDQFLEFGFVFGESDTILEGVSKVPPGTRLEFHADGSVRTHSYYSTPGPEPGDARGQDARVRELGETLTEVVGQHLRADVPVGVLLSGGLDSSVVAALAAASAPVTTISMGFGRSSIDERPHARRVAQHIGSNHLEIEIDPDQVKAEVERGAWVFDDLFADWGTITSRLMYRRCREQGIKVVLVGEGADELFGGYDVFRMPQRLSAWRRFQLYRRYAGRRYGSLFTSFDRIMRSYLAQTGGDGFSAIRLFESRRQLPNQFVMKVDKASMAESVEARAPYLDRRVSDLAFRTPREWLLRGEENKFLLRSLARDRRLVPDEISGRAKFGAPLAAGWMDDDARFRAFARERIFDGGWSRRLGLAPAMKSYFDEGRAGYPLPSSLSIFRNLAWRLLLLELWSTAYLVPAKPS